MKTEQHTIELKLFVAADRYTTVANELLAKGHVSKADARRLAAVETELRQAAVNYAASQTVPAPAPDGSLAKQVQVQAARAHNRAVQEHCEGS